MKAHTLIPLAAVASLFLIAAPRASADTITFKLSHVFSGPGVPAGDTPWLTATFQDVSDDNVSLTMSVASTIGSAAKVREWYFNIDPTFTATDLTNLQITRDTSTPPPLDTIGYTIAKGINAYKADGDGAFDLLFSFAESGEERFTPGESIVFNLSMPGLAASSFNFLSAPAGGDHGPFTTAAHVLGLGENEDSAWIAPVPEPSTVIGGLMLLLPIGVGVYRSMRRRA